ncbi:MAG: hypothetical protein QM758_06955 [Armatimonas sp.]
MFYISNILAALLLAAFLSFESFGRNSFSNWIFFVHAGLIVEIVFLFLSALALSFKKPRMAILFQSLAIFGALIEIGSLLLTLDRSDTSSSETMTATVVVMGLPLLPPLLSLFLLFSILKHTPSTAANSFDSVERIDH